VSGKESHTMSISSETPEQFEGPTATVFGNSVCVSGLRIDDGDFAAELSRLDDPENAGEICQSALELGVRVRKIANTSADALQLGEHIKRLDETFQRVTDSCSSDILRSVRLATDADTGLIANAVKRETAALSKVITCAFDENDKASALSKIQEAVNGSVQRIGDASVRSVRELLDAANPASPMSLLQAGIRKDVVQPVTAMLSTVREVKEAIEVRLAVQNAQQKGTQKGRKYEELTGACLEGCAAVAGDAIENVGDTEGYLGSKAGDHVLTICNKAGDSVRVVFESKDRKLSLRKTSEELTDAAKNRNAEVAVAVFSAQSNAPANSPLSRVAEGRFVVVYDKETQDELALRVAYQAARAEAITLLQRKSWGEVDVDFVLARVADARKQLDLVNQVEKGLNQAQTGIDATRTTAHALRDRLREILDRLEQNLTTEHRGAA
jgi:hypothetical protein